MLIEGVININTETNCRWRTSLNTNTLIVQQPGYTRAVPKGSRRAWRRRLCVRPARRSVQQHRPSFHFVFAKLTGSSALRLKRGRLGNESILPLTILGSFFTTSSSASRIGAESDYRVARHSSGIRR